MRRALVLVGLVACSSSAAQPAASPLPKPHPVGVGVGVGVGIELVESAPLETKLDHADIRNASEVWPEIIDRASKTLDFEEFYASDFEGGDNPLRPSLAAIERATKRGVKVRFIVDAAFAPKYPATLEKLRGYGVELRIIDVRKRSGGIQHAKFFVADGAESFVGSQNFDWRALQHIQEMGVRVESPAIAGGLEDIFETDWALANAETPSTFRAHTHPTPPVGAPISLYGSPADWLPDPAIGDLKEIVSLLDAAKSTIELQVLTYSTQMRDGSSFTTLDEALRRAASRGVTVNVIVSSWGAKENSHELRSVQALATVPNIHVKVISIAPWSGGDIPFARVCHSKFFLVDRRTAWVGTSNWEGDYFLKTRNVAIVTTESAVVPKLAKVWDDDWAISQPVSAPAGSAAPPASTGPARR